MAIWAAILLWVSVVFFVAALVVLGRRAHRTGRITPTFGAFLAALSVSWMEPILDWALHLYYSPVWAHFPTNWPLVRLIPYLPIVVPFAYTWYFFAGSVVSARLAEWSRPWIRHSQGLVLWGFLFGAGLSLVFENTFITLTGLWTYTQVIGPLSLSLGSDTHWPFAMAVVMGLTQAGLSWVGYAEDAEGCTPVQRLTQALRWRGRSRRSANGGWGLPVLGWVVAGNVIFGAVVTLAVLTRLTGLSDSVGTVQPYPGSKPIYDGIVTHCDDPSLNRNPIIAAVAAGLGSDKTTTRGCG